MVSLVLLGGKKSGSARHDSEFHPPFKNDTCLKQKRWRWISQRQTTTECALSHAKRLPFYQLHAENTISFICAFSKPKTSPLHELPQDGSRQGLFFFHFKKSLKTTQLKSQTEKNLYPRLYPCLKFIMFFNDVKFMSHLEIHPIAYTSTDLKIAWNDGKLEVFFFQKTWILSSS